MSKENIIKIAICIIVIVAVVLIVRSDSNNENEYSSPSIALPKEEVVNQVVEDSNSITELEITEELDIDLLLDFVEKM